MNPDIHEGLWLVATEQPRFADIVDWFSVGDRIWSDDDADNV